MIIIRMSRIMKELFKEWQISFVYLSVICHFIYICIYSSIYPSVYHSIYPTIYL